MTPYENENSINGDNEVYYGMESLLCQFGEGESDLESKEIEASAREERIPPFDYGFLPECGGLFESDERCRIERKKCREKKRRTEVNECFEELKNLMVHIEPSICASHTRQLKPIASANRTEILNRTIRVIRRLWSERQSMGTLPSCPSLPHNAASSQTLQMQSVMVGGMNNDSNVGNMPVMMMVPMFLPSMSSSPPNKPDGSVQQSSEKRRKVSDDGKKRCDFCPEAYRAQPTLPQFVTEALSEENEPENPTHA
eukprot:CAMPEP_0171483062 /NCGR_PEP_ID=MMETSP0946-20130122/7903_1 /TAXON_ID=109269 /ORGANISM="Vaucheria litorea, Strain CCMP2940" /LENGTH=254 /DNA_ID=CAMNT_0012015325 /DNA_START=105 /DNA_END=865 /DNA_ORIENTATION=-